MPPIAARTVNKERARAGESRDLGIEGRSKMTKSQLQHAVDAKK